MERINLQQRRRIDVVICVHNALDDVRLCLESVLSARNNSNQRIIIIDDGSDIPSRDYLEAVAAKEKHITLCRNRVAQGYTRAANQGLAQSSGELVILLNSDTIVTRDWAEKLADAVFSTPGAGIVGPMSNAASHQSIPEHRSTSDQTASNALPAGYSVEDMNQFCERLAVAGIFPRVPLIHGFCFGITRAAIHKLGGFDQEHFPNGYGEENDYCFRATDKGVGMVVATHTYIYHSKSKSYSREARIPLMKAGATALRKLHGDHRVERDIRTMENNPSFSRLRRAFAELYERPRATGVVSLDGESIKESVSQRVPTKLHNVLALIPLQKGGALLESSHIRIIRPLRHPSLADRLTLSVSGGECFTVQGNEVLLVQRDAVRSAVQAREIVDRCKSHRTKLILDVDDDFVNVSESHPDLSLLQRSEAIRIIASAADAVFVSTMTLKELMSQFSDSVHYLPNALDETLWLPGNVGHKRGNGDGSFRVLYMGKRIHRDDFAEIEDAINQLRSSYGDKLIFTCIASSCIGGSSKKERLSGITLEPVPKRAGAYPEFVKWMSNFRHYDIAVGPAGKALAHEHTSYLKYLDYGMCGLAPLMSDIPAYRQTVRHLENGLLVGNSSDAWLRSLQCVIDDKKLLKRLQTNAYRDVLEKYTLAAQAGERRKTWLTILDS